tara:strand:+ start:1038 stop:2099 length:1062 start_codon:yes stop_codon:yes gene_type:complete
MRLVHCFGAGLVGSYVARKLAESGCQVHIYDIEPKNSVFESYPNITLHTGDVLDYDLDILGNESIFVNMLPGEIGHKLTMELARVDGRRIVDLSFSEETPDKLSEDVIGIGTKILWDVGIAPGLSNMLLSEAYGKLGRLKKAEIRVGGNPAEKIGGWNYMAPFSPMDVIAEYSRPARAVRDGVMVTLPALSERHSIQVEGRGTMEAFLTDGLRSVIGSIPAEDMAEYTVRWPGHIERFIRERESNSLNIGNLIDEWRFDSEVPEFTWMEVSTLDYLGNSMDWIVCDTGGKDGSSMARTTGLVTVGCILAWIEDIEMLEPGIHAPESLSKNVVDSIIEMMRENGVEIVGPNVGK